MYIIRDALKLISLIPATFALSLFIVNASLAKPVKIVVLGDMPYGKDQVRSLEFIGSKIRKAGFPFVIHYGDFKGGGAKCDDSLLTKRRDVLANLVKGGLFYTPGDNDWTDCDRPQAGGYDELKRLDKIRSLFFSHNMPSKAEWMVARQNPDYPENARWTLGNLQFVTLHIVGSDNGRQEILKTDPPAKALNAVDARDEANLKWLDAAFDQAGKDNRDGLIIAAHADPADLINRKYRNRPCSKTERTACNPYLPFLQRLTKRANLFDKPVLFVHGSTNNFCLDQTYGGWKAAKLWRLNGPGDFVTIDAAVIRFDPHARKPFQIQGILTEDPVPPCDLQERLK